jgi:hypothetical protein
MQQSLPAPIDDKRCGELAAPGPAWPWDPWDWLFDLL